MPRLETRPPELLSPIEAWLTTLPANIDRDEAITAFLGASTALDRSNLGYSWNALWARPSQRLPAGDWRTAFWRAGRGYGKTRTATEGVRKLVNDGRAGKILLIGPTAADARDVMIEGPESGLLAVHPNETRPAYYPSKRLLEWPNGAIGYVRSAEEPDSVRGLNNDLVWGDEPAAWKTGRAAWDNAMLSNRIGKPHAILTGTPARRPWLKEIEAQPSTRVVIGSTYENIGNLAPEFIDLIVEMYEGTRLGRQELDAEYLEDVEGALWRAALIEATRWMRWRQADPWASLVEATSLEHRTALGLGAWSPTPGERRRWVTWVGVDPPGETAECGIVVATAPENGRGGFDHCIVLDDMSIAGPPEVWGSQVALAVNQWNAVGAVVEKNQGGDMVRSTVHAADPNVRVDKITSTQSKYDRAEPVSTLHAKGWIHFAGYFKQLEDQLTTWVADESQSPDRLDAFVHVVTKLIPLNPNAGGITSTVSSGLRR